MSDNTPDYQEQTKQNEAAFAEMVKQIRPEIWLLMDLVDQTGVNPFVLWKVGYAMKNISGDTKYGQVVLEIENDVVRFVRSIHADKLNEPVIKKEIDQT